MLAENHSFPLRLMQAADHIM